MTSHHDVAARLRDLGSLIARRQLTQRTSASSFLAKCADLLESQAKALSEAEAERAALSADLEMVQTELDTGEARLAEAMRVIKPFAKGWWTHQNPKAKVSVVFNHNPYDERDLCTVGDIHAARAFTNVAKEKT